MLEAAVEAGALWVLQVELEEEAREARSREQLEQLTQVEAEVAVGLQLTLVGLVVQVL